MISSTYLIKRSIYFALSQQFSICIIYIYWIQSQNFQAIIFPHPNSQYSINRSIPTHKINHLHVIKKQPFSGSYQLCLHIYNPNSQIHLHIMTLPHSSALRYINLIVNLISLCGSLFIISVYLFRHNLRSYPFKLVAYMAISNCILSFAYMLGAIDTAQSGPLCSLQGFLINCSQLSSLVWTMIISYCLLRSIKERVDMHEEVEVGLEEYEWRFVIIGYIVPLLMSMLPFFNSVYESTLYYCWISFVNTPLNITEQLIEFYLPLTTAIIYNIYATIKVKKFVNQHTDQTSNLNYFSRIMLYPIILVICWSPKLLTRTLFFFKIDYFWLFVIDSLLGGLVGLLNSIIYGTNRTMIEHFWKNCCRREDPDTSRRTIELMEKDYHERSRSKTDTDRTGGTKVTKGEGNVGEYGRKYSGI